MSQVFWQAKIWGLLHNPVLNALKNHHEQEKEGDWAELDVMSGWKSPKTENDNPVLKWIAHADLIAAASDRAAIDNLDSSVVYGANGLEISHLLSGEKISAWKLPEDKHRMLTQTDGGRSEFLSGKEKDLFPEWLKKETDLKKVFWWLWRCLPEETCQVFGDSSLLLMPADTRLPDSSIWNHSSLTAALAGALTGYDLSSDELTQWSGTTELSHPYLAAFSFTPIQELIKASRKMRDFWAGSWLLHYLSAKVCWALANKYGPDSFIYPNLFQQPLIDHWLRQDFPDFDPWIPEPPDRQLLTAGFPNVLILVLPKDKVDAAMQYAEETLKKEWLYIGHLVFEELADNRRWMQKLKKLPALNEEHKTWKGWLSQQWQVYWSAVAIGKEGEDFASSGLPDSGDEIFQSWLNIQNLAFEVSRNRPLFQRAELDFLRKAGEISSNEQIHRVNVNIGSWWPYIFGKTRSALAGIKNARTWELPTTFSVRSTVSGLGPAVHPGADWIEEGVVKQLWKRHAGLFDGNEQLNATETLKRGLHKVIEKLFALGEATIEASYPDLTAGVAGYLKVHEKDQKHLEYFHQTCRAVVKQLKFENVNASKLTRQRWGIPWIDDHQDETFQQFHSRYLNAGWLAEEVTDKETEALETAIRKASDPDIVSQLNSRLLELRRQYRENIRTVLERQYASNNPADWYVLAVGDGDGMNEWLRGNKLENYEAYISKALSVPSELQPSFDQFIQERKRMGPSTHGALSRALLDFSNQLVPYLTEQRYAGRLIYGGGDDVMAYSNLWEWVQWLWDIHECFRGEPDPRGQFDHQGDYWQWNRGDPPSPLSSRPLFTMGKKATISFGVVIAHHSVPLAIALESLWDAEKVAKKHVSPEGEAKDAVQVRVLYGNGNTLKATTKFDVFHLWQQLVDGLSALDSTFVEKAPALFEQAAQVWEQHPAPVEAAIPAWTIAFCDRRDLFNENEIQQEAFCDQLTAFLRKLWQVTKEADWESSDSSKIQESQRDREIENWLKLAAFVLRKRYIKLPRQQEGGQA
jgi:CRISPR-associated protein Cmr2